jgi:hypothetical protein
VLRTVISAAFPRAAVGHKLPLFFVESQTSLRASFYANLNSLALDYAARQKVGGTSLTYFILKQLPVLPPNGYQETDLAFVLPRVLELTYTAEDMRPFAEDLGYDGPPFPWDQERRALLRAELDAYYAYLYGLSRDELRYILDPADVYGPDYPSETFRVLKNNEIKAFGEYRTRRLVLEAYDRFARDGTFAPERLRDAAYFETVSRALVATQEHLAEVERMYEALLRRAEATPLPTLFVEGETDVAIIEAAWRAFFPGEALPVAVLAAGGTKQMGSLAGKGKALRQALGDRVVCALADNDFEGRALIDEGHVRRGGTWKQLPNGIHWCLLAPTAEFVAVMNRFEIPREVWPYTIEACFPAALRRQALAQGAYGFSDEVMAELMKNEQVARRLFTALRDLDPADDAYFYLMAPAPEAKDRFAAWVTKPEQCTKENYAPLGEILNGLRALVERRSSIEKGVQEQRDIA